MLFVVGVDQIKHIENVVIDHFNREEEFPDYLISVGQNIQRFDMPFLIRQMQLANTCCGNEQRK